MYRATRPAVRRAVHSLLLLVLTFALVAPAVADVRDADLLGGAAVASAPALRGAAPDMAVPSAILVTGDGQVLWARDADAERAMASTTKIMTALVALGQVQDLAEQVTVASDAVKVGEADVGLRSGQELPFRRLVEAMLVHSGNDAAIALAIHISGSEDAFVALMNDKAAELGLTHTHFSNVHGLDERGHYTSAADLVTLAQVAMGNEVIRNAVASKTVSIPKADGSGEEVFKSSNKLLTTLEGANGIKTGWTNDAGYCLVASADRDGIELVAVILGARTERGRFTEAERLLNWGFEHYAMRTLTSVETTAAQLVVTDYLDVTVPVVVGETTATPVFDVWGDVGYVLDVPDELAAPVTKGQRVGTLSVTQGERLLVQVPVVAARDVAAPTLVERVKIAVTRLWRRLFGGSLQAQPVTVL
jgi:D-alanyl-D-alanine carboxypeptidase